MNAIFSERYVGEWIALGEYAQRHGRDADSTRRLAARGGFRTACRDEAGEWIVRDDEPYPEDLSGLRMGDVLGREADDLGRTERHALMRGVKIQRLSRYGRYPQTFGRLWDYVTPSLAETCTPEQLAQIVDILHDAYDAGRAAPAE